MKTSIKFIGTVMLAVVVFGCSKDDGVTVAPVPVQETPEPETPAPVVSLNSINPMNGPKTTIVTLSGNNFGTDLEEVKVFFNEKEAVVLEVKNEEIKAEVPAQAYTGIVKVVIDEIELIGPEFTYQITENMVSTWAGSIEGFADGPGTDAKFNRPTGLAIDSQGNAYVADPINNRIRKISPEGEVTTLAGGTQGSQDGFGTEAHFNAPWDVDVDTQGNVYVADSGNHRIRRISPDGNVITLAGSTIGSADGMNTDASFNAPRGVAVTTDGIVYVADSGNKSLRKIDKEENVSTFPGSFGIITGLTVDNEGLVYIVSSSGHSVWKLDYDNSGIDYVAGNNGEGDEDGNPGKFRYPKDIAVDTQGNLYVADEGNNKIRKITTDGQVETYAGGTFGSDDGSGTSAQFKLPYGLAVSANGDVYVADTSNHRIRKITQE